MPLPFPSPLPTSPSSPAHPLPPPLVEADKPQNSCFRLERAGLLHSCLRVLNIG